MIRHTIKRIVANAKSLSMAVSHLIATVVFFRWRAKSALVRPEDSNDKLLILGNGPSLVSFLADQEALIGQSELLAVNHFATGDEFERLRPQHYLIVDPLFFTGTGSDLVLSKVAFFVEAMTDKLSWPMSLYFPTYYRRSELILKLGQIDCLQLMPIRNVPLSDGMVKLKYWLFDMGLGNPVYQNVLIAAVFLGIRARYTELHLSGADHSWLAGISVDQGNRIILHDKHAHEDRSYPLTDEKGQNKPLHIFLDQLSRMFCEYHVVAKYARRSDVRVFNHSKNSYIDAFERLI